MFDLFLLFMFYLFKFVRFVSVLMYLKYIFTKLIATSRYAHFRLSLSKVDSADGDVGFQQGKVNRVLLSTDSNFRLEKVGT